MELIKFLTQTLIQILNLRGVKFGRGKVYDEVNGQLEFEGNYLKGKRWNGKGFNKNSKRT